MNFLLHRHLAAAELGSEAAGIGAMLPDLWRMADRRVRPRRDALAGEADPSLAAVLAGVAHHVAADAWFHATPAMIDGERRTVELLRVHGVEAPRMRLLSHVLWEMCLDGALVRRAGLDATLRALRRGLAETRAAADRAAERLHFAAAGRSAAERAAFEARMSRLLEELARGPWIEGYQHGEGLAMRAAGVRARVGLAPPPAGDLVRLAAALGVLAGEAAEALERLLTARARAVEASG